MKPHNIAWVNTYGFKLFVSSNELVNIGKAKAVDPTIPPNNISNQTPLSGLHILESQVVNHPGQRTQGGNEHDAEQ